MDWLNYHHLYYFWTVVREGSITAAANRLLLAPPTISAQIRELEEALGEKLFHRTGRGLTLTEAGQTAFRYANEIFSLGREFVDAIKGHTAATRLKVSIGINDVIPKQVAYRLIEPAFQMPGPVRVECIQGTPAQLLPPLAANDLDLVLSDAPAAPEIRVRAFSHLLGESPLKIYAAPELARKLRRKFPQSLNGAPALLPAASSALRVSLDKWFESRRVRPQVAGEFEDIALLSISGERGRGFFVGYSAIEEEFLQTARVEAVGTVKGHQGRFYAITVERQIRHPAIAAIIDAARTQVFA